MLNDAKYKSCLTLILTSSNPPNEQNTDIQHESTNELIFNEIDKNSSIETNQLSFKMNRTIVHSESFNESLKTNETIIPIKYEETNIQQQDITSTETSPKYCCTLEVKFVWYDIE